MMPDKRFPDPDTGVLTPRRRVLRNAHGRKREVGEVIEGNYSEATSEDVHFLAAERKEWEIHRISGKQARVAAPGSQKRQRREKRPMERVENERRLKNALIAGALLVGGGGGVAAGRYLRKHPKATGALEKVKEGIKRGKPRAMMASRKRKPKNVMPIDGGLHRERA